MVDAMDRGGSRENVRTKSHWQSWALVCAALLLATAATAAVLENEHLRVVVDDGTGRLLELASPANGFNLVDPTVDRPLWRVELQPLGHAALAPSDAHAFNIEVVEGRSRWLRMVWSDFQIDAAPGLSVVVSVHLDQSEPNSRWNINVSAAGDLPLAQIIFPRVGGITKQESEALAVPVWMGEKTDNPRQLLNANGKARRDSWKYPGLLSMQCLALCREGGPGFYAACDDSEGHGKDFVVFGDGEDGLGFEAVQYPDSTENYNAPYDIYLGVFEGDWFTAAERYRSSALRQPWAKENRLTTGATPPWCVDTGLWVWNRGYSQDVLEPAAVLQEAAGLPVSVFWHWWHGCAYDAGFPEYLPPREGTEPFMHAVAKAHDEGLHAIVYMNQRLWGMETDSWTEKHAARFAVKRPDGEIQPEVYNTFTKSPCASMCMGTPFWRDTYAGIATEAVLALGVDGIYMDQACSSLACYDPNHGHILGGGTYWINGFQLLQQDIRDRTKADGRQVTLAGEGCGEAWLPYLDLMLSLQVSMERYHEPGPRKPIPFFHAVYHGLFIPFGNYASLTMPPYDPLWPEETAPKEPLALLDRKFSQQFRMDQARAFVWGQVPTVANFRPEHLTARDDEMDFVIRLAKLRQRALPYLLHGTMLRPPAMDIPEEVMPISRLSIYAGQQGALSEYEAAYPLLPTSAWKTREGNVAVVVVNIDAEPHSVSFTWVAKETPLPSPGTLHVLEDDGTERVTQYDQPSAIDEELPGASARVYEWRRDP